MIARIDLVRLAHEETQGFISLHFAFSEMAHAVHKLVPTGDGFAELRFHCLRIEAGIVRNFDGSASTGQSDGLGVVTHDPDRGKRCRGGQGAVIGRRQQQITVYLVFALRGCDLPRTRQRPEFAAAFEYAGRFQVVARDLGEISVEFQQLAGCTVW